MSVDFDKTELVNYRISRALEAIDEVEFLLANGKLNLAVNRIYYGIFYILSALALKHGFSTSKHKQLIGWFNKEFIKTEIISKDFSDTLHEAYAKRTKGDYDDFAEFSLNEVLDLFGRMKLLVNNVKELLKEC